MGALSSGNKRSPYILLLLDTSLFKNRYVKINEYISVSKQYSHFSFSGNCNGAGS